MEESYPLFEKGEDVTTRRVGDFIFIFGNEPRANSKFAAIVARLEQLDDDGTAATVRISDSRWCDSIEQAKMWLESRMM